MTQDSTHTKRPEILAPAGDKSCFLAALAAGANAIYLGLKNFSARMEAENFSLLEVSRLTDLAHQEGARVYITLNTMLKKDELNQAYRLLRRLETQAGCDGIIIQDLAFITLAHEANFSGGVFLSTLANVTHPKALTLAANLGCQRVILPRELSIDEIRSMGEACPDNLDLELFVHGALCYCVSGRCYWSSYLGGKSGLRGRCVQPCRRLYQLGATAPSQKSKGREVKARYFSCQDLSIDVLAKTLLDIPHLVSWKIEGRKKGPHYVYHVVKAYAMLRDNPEDSAAKRDALDILDLALGRPSTHARFLPQKTRIPTDPSGVTASGLFIGLTQKVDNQIQLKPKIPLKPQDYLRIGSEEDKFHQTFRVTYPMPKGKVQTLNLKMTPPPAGTPVFLIDRREKELVNILRTYQQKLTNISGRETKEVNDVLKLPKGSIGKRRSDMRVLANIPNGKENRASSQHMLGLWVAPKTIQISRPVARRVFWWLPPVIWPDEEKKIQNLVHGLWQDGCRHYVCNAPWQRALFPDELPDGADLVAGPFCNLANPLSLDILKSQGFKAAFASPELGREDLLALPKASPLPLGFVISGFWPVGISRFGLLGLKTNTPFSSPKGEVFWIRDYGQNSWIYPAWPLDFKDKQAELLNAGYCFFATILENQPQNLPVANRPGHFNYDGQLI
ncbi:MAG: U32 family peptidase [Desulfovibrionaceae bacterium]|nr:U32 family peptidase [Desulfovibrionaceae bacterium]